MTTYYLITRKDNKEFIIGSRYVKSCIFGNLKRVKNIIKELAIKNEIKEKEFKTKKLGNSDNILKYKDKLK